MGASLGLLKVGGWAFTQTLNKEGKKIEIFQLQRMWVGDNMGMGNWKAKYGIYNDELREVQIQTYPCSMMS